MKVKKDSLALSFAINTTLTIIEFVAGITSGSVALIADGSKNLTDSIMLLVAILAEKLSGKSKTMNIKIKKYAAVINIAVISVVAIEVLFESAAHLLRPEFVDGRMVTSIGILAVLLNLSAALIIQRKKQVAAKAAYWGLISSALSGLGVFASGIVTSVLHTQIFDSSVGIAIAMMLLVVAYRLGSQALLASD